jgi:hypothetical protein
LFIQNHILILPLNREPYRQTKHDFKTKAKHKNVKEDKRRITGHKWETHYLEGTMTLAEDKSFFIKHTNLNK